MEHLGDITKISGYTAPVVDCIIGGSPCQDLSVAGKRAGLDGERSGLYMEQIRIVKEMRERDERNGRSGVDIRPRYMVWENVPGAFSSNKGEDFRIVLEEIAKVAHKDAVIPPPPNGKWTSCGCIVGDGWSIAWRVLDAQFWGTSDKPLPQRRRRIALVADFGGQSALEILFVRKSVSGDIEPCEPKRKATPSNASRGIGADDREGEGFDRYNQCLTGDVCATLRAPDGGDNCACVIERGRGDRGLDDVAYTLKIRSGCEGGGKGALVQKDKSATLATNNDQYLFQPVTDSHILDDQGGASIAVRNDGKAPTLRAETHGNLPCVTEEKVVTLEPRIAAREGGHIYEGVSGTLRANAGDNQMATAYSVENHPNDSRVGINEDGKVQALTSRMGTGGGNVPMVMQQCFSKSKIAQSATDNETWVESDTANTLNAFDVGDVRTTEAVVYALDRASYNQGKNAQYDFEISDKGINSPLVAKGPGAVCYGINGDKAGTLDSSYYKGCGMRSGVEREVVAIPAKTRYIVRRITPLECERLQGYPDGWTDIGEWTDTNGKKRQTSDAARYKALGNSIALPPWKWVLKRLCACYERDATMASLFDGIGGFPYLWEQLNGKGTCLWASEIEEFPIAVTKVRFSNDKTHNQMQ